MIKHEDLSDGWYVVMHDRFLKPKPIHIKWRYDKYVSFASNGYMQETPVSEYQILNRIPDELFEMPKPEYPDGLYYVRHSSSRMVLVRRILYEKDEFFVTLPSVVEGVLCGMSFHEYEIVSRLPEEYQGRYAIESEERN